MTRFKHVIIILIRSDETPLNDGYIVNYIYTQETPKVKFNFSKIIQILNATLPPAKQYTRAT